MIKTMVAVCKNIETGKIIGYEIAEYPDMRVYKVTTEALKMGLLEKKYSVTNLALAGDKFVVTAGKIEDYDVVYYNSDGTEHSVEESGVGYVVCGIKGDAAFLMTGRYGSWNIQGIDDMRNNDDNIPMVNCCEGAATADGRKFTWEEYRTKMREYREKNLLTPDNMKVIEGTLMPWPGQNIDALYDKEIHGWRRGILASIDVSYY